MPIKKTIKQAKQVLALIFSPQPDLSTSEGRGKERYRQALRTSLGAMITRVASILMNFIVVPLTLPYLGKEQFGLWMMLTSVTFFMVYSDLGLGIGLQNRLSDCMGRDDRDNPKYYVSSALFIMSLLFILLVVMAIFLLPHIDLGRFIKSENSCTRALILPTTQAMLIAFGIGLPIEIIQRIYNAYQRGFWSYIMRAAGTICSLVGVILCINYRVSLPILVFVFVAGRHVIPLLGNVVLFSKWSWLRPSFKYIRIKHIKHIYSLGISGIGTQIAAILLVAGPAVIIANRIGTGDVTPFSVTQKLLGVMNMVLTMSIWSLWPAYSEAYARKDWIWIRKTFYRTIKIALMMMLPTIVISALAGRWVIGIWTGKDSAVPSWSLLMAWTTWTFLRGGNTTFQIILSGLHRMKGQAIYGNIVGILGLSAAWFAMPHGLSLAIWLAVLVGEGLRTLLMGIETSLILQSQSMLYRKSTSSHSQSRRGKFSQ